MASYHSGDPYFVPQDGYFRSMSTSAGIWYGPPVVLLTPDQGKKTKGRIATTPFNDHENNCIHAFFDTAGLTPLPETWTSTTYGTSANLPVIGSSYPKSTIINWGSSGSAEFVLERRNSRYTRGTVVLEWKPYLLGFGFVIVTRWQQYDTTTYWSYGTACMMTYSGGVVKYGTTHLGGSSGYSGEPKTTQWGWDNIPKTTPYIGTIAGIPAPSGAAPDPKDPLEEAHRIGAFSVDPRVWGEMATNCINDFQLFQSNGLMYTIDLLTLKSLFKGSAETIGRLMTTPSAKLAAQGYLTWHYGLRLMMKDTEELIKAIKSYSFRLTTRRQHRTSAVQQLDDGRIVRLSMYAAPYDERMNELLRMLNEFDFLPTLANLWDVVPFSFVVDWIFNVSSLLEGLDAQMLKSVIPIRYSCMTVKGSLPVSLGGDSKVIGNGAVHFYKRTFIHGPVNPRIPIVTPTPEGLLDKTLEGSALVITNIG